MLIIASGVVMMLFIFFGGGDWLVEKIDMHERRKHLSKVLQSAMHDDLRGTTPQSLTAYFPDGLRTVDLTARDIAFLEKRFAKMQQNVTKIQAVQDVLTTVDDYRLNRRAALQAIEPEDK